jgi:hypothetical protein
MERGKKMLRAGGGGGGSKTPLDPPACGARSSASSAVARRRRGASSSCTVRRPPGVTAFTPERNGATAGGATAGEWGSDLAVERVEVPHVGPEGPLWPVRSPLSAAPPRSCAHRARRPSRRGLDGQRGRAGRGATGAGGPGGWRCSPRGRARSVSRTPGRTPTARRLPAAAPESDA